MQRFSPAPWDKAAAFASRSIPVGFILLYAVFLSLFPEWAKGLALHIVFAAFLGILALAYLLRPTAYILKEKGIVIERGWGKISIPYSCIKGVKIATKPLVSSRLFVGNGGLFGYYGFFYDQEGRTVRVYATRTDQMVQLETEKDVFYISPSNPQAFMEALQEKLLAVS